jgi:hypothetical protein
MDSMLLLFGLGAIYCTSSLASQSGTALLWLWLGAGRRQCRRRHEHQMDRPQRSGLIGLLWLWDQPHEGAKPGGAASVKLRCSPYSHYFYVCIRILDPFPAAPPLRRRRRLYEPTFQSTLKGNPSYTLGAHMSFFDKFTELNAEMYRANQTLTATHPYGSRWYTWPLEQRLSTTGKGDRTLPMAARAISTCSATRHLVGLLDRATEPASATYWQRNATSPPPSPPSPSPASPTSSTSCRSWPSPVMFLYHYFFSLCFSIVFVVVMLWNDLATHPARTSAQNPRRRACSARSWPFWPWLPLFRSLSYGFPSSPRAFKHTCGCPPGARCCPHTWTNSRAHHYHKKHE